MTQDGPSAGLEVIAIDGPAGSGKSTVARALARRLGLEYLDTGAMYRSVAFAAIRHGVDPEDTGPVASLAKRLKIDVTESVTVDGVDATIEIRGPEVTRAVSVVAANPEVRVDMRDRQRAWARERGGGVVEGRDIGTVVFPDAKLKVYLTADHAERARRRHREAAGNNYDGGSPALAVEAVKADLARRDHADSTRAASPLAVADDALVIDTTGRAVDEIVEDLYHRVRPVVVPPGFAPPRSNPSARPPAVAPAAPTMEGVYRPTAKGRLGQISDRLLYHFCRFLIVVVARTYNRMTIDGREHLPRSGPFVVAPVHRSNIDTPLVGAITTRRMRFMGKDSLWRSRGGARFFSALGGFPVVRGTADRDAMRRCMEVIDGGEPLVLFPEGTRQSGPKVMPLFEGAVYVAVKTGVPIIPVGIGGTEKAMPKGSKMIHPARIAIVIGEPIVPPPTDGRRTSRRAIHELTTILESRLQELFDTAQARAGG